MANKRVMTSPRVDIFTDLGYNGNRCDAPILVC